MVRAFSSRKHTKARICVKDILRHHYRQGKSCVPPSAAEAGADLNGVKTYRNSRHTQFPMYTKSPSFRDRDMEYFDDLIRVTQKDDEDLARIHPPIEKVAVDGRAWRALSAVAFRHEPEPDCLFLVGQITVNAYYRTAEGLGVDVR